MRKRVSIGIALLIGIAIGAGLPQGMFGKGAVGKLFSQKVLATEGEGEGGCGPGEFDDLTVTETSNLEGTVTIGTSANPVAVNTNASTLQTTVTGPVDATYLSGFINVYGDLTSDHYSLLFGGPNIYDTAPASYCLGFMSTDRVLQSSPTALMLLGGDGTAYTNDPTSPSLTGAILGGLDGNGNLQSGIQLAADADGNGDAYLAAGTTDGATSSLEVDTAGNVVIQLGGPATLSTSNSQQAASQTTTSQNRAAVAATAPAPSPINHVIGVHVPSVQDVVSAVQQPSGQ